MTCLFLLKRQGSLGTRDISINRDCCILARFEAHEIVSIVYLCFEDRRKLIISYPCERETGNKKSLP